MCHLRPSDPPPTRHTFRPHRYAFLVTRQNASAFNQPLNFDTSKVTTMKRMFAVRSARARVPNLESGSPRAHVPLGPPPHARLPAMQRAPLAPHRVLPSV